MNTPINQHYVPQFLLRNFQIPEKRGKESAIFTFDKSTHNEYQTPIKTTAAERYFYEVKEESYTIEDKLGEYESITGEIVRKVLENQSIKKITNKEKVIIAKFIALQILRVPAMRNRFTQFTDLIEERFNYFGSRGIPKPSEAEEKISHCNFVLNTMNDFFPFVYNKDWVLCESVNSDYIIGDNPVVLNNTFNKGRGNLGLASNGVEIYMPISPKYCLLLICRSVRKSISEPLLNSPVNSDIQPSISRLKEFVRKLKFNETITSAPENVMFVNSLQVMFAERFLYSHKKSFDLPKQMAIDGTLDNKIFHFD